MDYTIRSIKEAEYKISSNFLCEAIFIPEGVKAPSKNITYKPEFRLSNSVKITYKGDPAKLFYKETLYNVIEQ